eukprot:scaffold462_cov195-Pinguiococcus_pyrenoidosus.AAC.49
MPDSVHERTERLARASRCPAPQLDVACPWSGRELPWQREQHLPGILEREDDRLQRRRVCLGRGGDQAAADLEKVLHHLQADLHAVAHAVQPLVVILRPPNGVRRDASAELCEFVPMKDRRAQHSVAQGSSPLSRRLAPRAATESSPTPWRRSIHGLSGRRAGAGRSRTRTQDAGSGDVPRATTSRDARDPDRPPAATGPCSRRDSRAARTHAR